MDTPIPDIILWRPEDVFSIFGFLWSIDNTPGGPQIYDHKSIKSDKKLVDTLHP